MTDSYERSAFKNLLQLEKLDVFFWVDDEVDWTHVKKSGPLDLKTAPYIDEILKNLTTNRRN